MSNRKRAFSKTIFEPILLKMLASKMQKKEPCKTYKAKAILTIYFSKNRSLKSQPETKQNLAITFWRLATLPLAKANFSTKIKLSA